jgi:hypothetical protein
MVAAACKRLMTVHQSFDNFYNEPPFAERLLELSQSAVPDSAKEAFVETVVTCSVGNAYGTSRAADVSYIKMVRRFSPKEVEVLFHLLEKNNVLMVRVKAYKRCELELRSVIGFINEETVPAGYKKSYRSWTKEQ